MRASDSAPSTPRSKERTMRPPSCLSDLPIPTPPPMANLFMTSRFDLSARGGGSYSFQRLLHSGGNSEFGGSGHFSTLGRSGSFETSLQGFSNARENVSGLYSRTRHDEQSRLFSGGTPVLTRRILPCPDYFSTSQQEQVDLKKEKHKKYLSTDSDLSRELEEVQALTKELRRNFSEYHSESETDCSGLLENTFYKNSFYNDHYISDIDENEEVKKFCFSYDVTEQKSSNSERSSRTSRTLPLTPSVRLSKSESASSPQLTHKGDAFRGSLSSLKSSDFGEGSPLFGKIGDSSYSQKILKNPIRPVVKLAKIRREIRFANRQIRDAANPFELPNTFIKLFRLNKEAAQYLIHELEPYMAHVLRQTGIPNYLKILCTLHFFGHGSYQLDIGYGGNLCLSQPSVSRCIGQVSEVIIARLVNTWIHFPSTVEEITNKKRIFSEKYEFPHTIGAIDGTHVAIVTPPINHPVYPAAPYLNRKGFYSINVQIIVDAHLEILNMNARYPGSVHDAAIWMMSNINRHMRDKYLNENVNYHLIGDEGYPLSPWLMVKYPGNIDPNTAQGRYNQRLKMSRNCVEQLNGRLKGRFRCILKDRTLHYDPLKGAKIVYSCGILHNICQHFRVPFPENEEIPADNNDNLYANPIDNVNNNVYLQGQRKRDFVIQTYFN